MAEGFQYTLLRLVPRIDRGERFNVGVVVYCPRRRFLGCRTWLDEGRLLALAPECDADQVRAHLDSIAAVVAGSGSVGPLAGLEPSERFGWVAAPSSTVIQPSEVHTGVTDAPQRTLDHLFATLVK